jgi:hypothetical protein
LMMRIFEEVVIANMSIIARFAPKCHGEYQSYMVHFRTCAVPI